MPRQRQFLSLTIYQSTMGPRNNYIQIAQRGQSPTGEVFRIENGGAYSGVDSAINERDCSKHSAVGK